MFSKIDIEKYFFAEKLESLVYISIGVTGMIIALVMMAALALSADYFANGGLENVVNKL